MQPLVSVNTHTHISLISFHVTPSTFLAALILFFVFLFTYVVATGGVPLRTLSPIRFPSFGRRAPPIVNPGSLVIEEVEEIRFDKRLPALPAPETKRPLLQLTQTPHSSRSSSSRSLRSLFSTRTKALPSSTSDPSLRSSPRPGSSPGLGAKASRTQSNADKQLVRLARDDDVNVLLRGQSGRRRLRDPSVAATEEPQSPTGAFRLWLLGRGSRRARRERRQL
ncbi:hypothetical protein F4803DRAFT_39516 [Xylaria telfairii]|nr:hypothetical protein F4803DRAFT_39516 [Xylaria telfairii]